MVSTDSTSTFRTRMMPAVAILRHDLRSLFGSWLVRIWLVGSVLLTLPTLGGGWPELTNAPMIGSILFPYLVIPWFLVAIVLGVSPITGTRAEALADGILSRPIARYEYLLATWAARVLTVIFAYLIVTIPFILLIVYAKRPVDADPVTFYGIVASLGLVGLVQAFLVSLGFLAGTLLRRPILAMVLLIFIWFPVNLMLNAFALEEFSPISLNQALPTLLRQTWNESDSTVAATIEEKELEEDADHFLKVLLGQSEPVRPKREPGFFDRDEFEDFSLVRVVLGYSIPTFLAIGLATVVFSRRDL